MLIYYDRAICIYIPPGESIGETATLFGTVSAHTLYWIEIRSFNVLECVLLETNEYNSS